MSGNSVDQINNVVDEINNLLAQLPPSMPLEVVDEDGNEANLYLQSLKFEPEESLIRVWCNSHD